METQYPYMDDTRSISWNGDFTEQLRAQADVTEENIATVAYTPEHPRDVYEKSYTCISVPTLELLPQYRNDYRFRLTPFFGYLMCTAELSGGPEFTMSLTPFSQLCLFTTLVEKEEAKDEKRKMGIYTACTDWVVKLPASKYYYRQMWGYSLLKEKSILKWMIATLSHKYVYDLNLEKYIETEKFDLHSGEYVRVKSSMSMFSGSPALTPPSLFCVFGIMTPEEKAVWEEKQLDTFYVYDMIPIASKEGEISYASSVGLAQAIFFALEAKGAAGCDHVFNYTTDAVPTKKSRSGISSVSFPNMSPNTSYVPVDLYTAAGNTYIPGIFTKRLANKLSHGNNGGSMIQRTGAKTSWKAVTGLDMEGYKIRVEVLVLRKYTVARDRSVSFVHDYPR